MTDRDPKCVRVVATLETAEAVAAWLGEQGMPAKARPAASPDAADFEVWIDDPNQAEEARRLLAELAEWLASRKEKKEVDATPVEVICEDCGQATTYPGKERGTVQHCGHCESYVDVPGDDDWEAPGEEAGPDE